MKEALLVGSAGKSVVIKHIPGNDYLEIDGARFSFPFFGVMSRPDDRSTYRFTRDKDDALCLEVVWDAIAYGDQSG